MIPATGVHRALPAVCTVAETSSMVAGGKPAVVSPRLMLSVMSLVMMLAADASSAALTLVSTRMLSANSRLLLASSTSGRLHHSLLKCPTFAREARHVKVEVQTSSRGHLLAVASSSILSIATSPHDTPAAAVMASVNLVYLSEVKAAEESRSDSTTRTKCAGAAAMVTMQSVLTGLAKGREHAQESYVFLCATPIHLLACMCMYGTHSD
jgi:hypothetical protein